MSFMYKKILYSAFIFLIIMSGCVCQLQHGQQQWVNNLRKQQLLVNVNDVNDDGDTYQLSQTLTSTTNIIIQSQSHLQQQQCNPNFTYNTTTHTCICPQENNFIYIQSSQQCKCFLGQIRINQKGVKICQKTQQINIGLFCVGLVVDFFIIYGVYKCCCGKGSGSDGYRREGDNGRGCERGFVRCLCWCLFHKQRGHHHNHHNHHNNHNHHNRDHHHHNHNNHHHHHNHNPSILTQQ